MSKVRKRLGAKRNLCFFRAKTRSAAPSLVLKELLYLGEKRVVENPLFPTKPGGKAIMCETVKV